MANAQSDKTNDRSTSLICAVCLEVFTSPKILPCFHTFCERCLKDLQNTHAYNDGFPCPSCRKWTDVPRGGVSAFQTNFYIDPEELEAARNGFLCTRHPRLELELFCDNCNDAICLKCKTGGHKKHSTQNLQDVAVPVKREKQAVDEKRKVLRKEVLRRKTVLHAAVNQISDDVLANLDKIADAVTGQMTEQWVKTVCRPVFHYSATSDATLQRMRDYMGSAVKMEMAVSAPEVSVVKQFRCRQDPDNDICHVCPIVNGEVLVSFQSHVSGGAAIVEEYTPEGRVAKRSKKDAPGRISAVRKTDSGYIYLQSTTDVAYNFAKTIGDNGKLFYVLISKSEKAIVWPKRFGSEKQLNTDVQAIFRITGNTHRAVDVTASEQLCAVVEEGKAPDFMRRVQLYRPSASYSIATYKPPVTPFQPSDVCFYTLGGQEVLLVADELNDAIHVVNVQDGHLNFLRYLAPGCPLLVQPMALNTDTRGRLWIACRGGRILTCTPISK